MYKRPGPGHARRGRLPRQAAPIRVDIQPAVRQCRRRSGEKAGRRVRRGAGPRVRAPRCVAARIAAGLPRRGRSGPVLPVIVEGVSEVVGCGGGGRRRVASKVVEGGLE